MKLKMNGFSVKAQHPLLLAAATAPLAIFLTAAIHPPALKGLPVLPLACVAFCWLCLLLPGRWRVSAAAASALALSALAVVVLPVREAWALLLLPAAYSVLLFLFLPVAAWPRERELPPYFAVGGAVAHLLLHLAAGYSARTGSALYEPAAGFRLVSFLLYVVLALLALNRSSLSRAAQDRVQVPQRMRRQNIALTLGLLMLALVLAALPAIGAFLQRLWNALWRAVGAAAAWIAALLRTDTAGSGGGGGAPLPGGFENVAPAEPSLLEQIIEKLLGVIAVAAVAALVLFLAQRLYRLLRRLFGWLRQRFARFGAAAVKDYVDEITDTRDGAAYEPTGLLRRVRERFYRQDESRMDPTQRVRYRYLRLRLRHGEWLPAATARETLPAAAAQLYERARYGAQPLTGQEAQQFQQETRQL